MKKIFVILFGIIFIVVGIFLLINGKQKAKRCTEEIIGTIVEIKEETSTDTNGVIEYTYYPIIEYQVGEKTITKQSSTGSNTSKYNLNDKIDLLYNPNNIEEFIIKGDKSSNYIGIVFIVLGTITFFVGLFKTF